VRFGLGAKLHTITVAAPVGVVAVSGIGLVSLKSQIEQDRMAKTRNPTDGAYGVAAYFEGDWRL